jgi:hypothetical protein
LCNKKSLVIVSAVSSALTVRGTEAVLRGSVLIIYELMIDENIQVKKMILKKNTHLKLSGFCFKYLQKW